jgi:hypothetical protein
MNHFTGNGILVLALIFIILRETEGGYAVNDKGAKFTAIRRVVKALRGLAHGVRHGRAAL